MDRLDRLHAFVTILDEGSLASAGRKLGRSPAAMTRALAGLEAQLGAKLVDRGTRFLRLTEAGAQYEILARSLLAAVENLDSFSPGTSEPRGVLTVTGPVTAGAEILRPVLDDFLDEHAGVRARLLLFDRVAGLIEEGIDIALRIANLPDSSLVAIPIGTVRRVVCASPGYLAEHGSPRSPSELKRHQIIALAESRQEDHWSFPLRETNHGGSRIVPVHARLSVNNVAAARASAREGRGLTRLFSYQVASDILAGELTLILPEYEGRLLPVNW
jgi:DNA-binding transcriptional LysR family regulator